MFMLLCRSELSVPHSSVHLAKVGAIDAHVEGSGKRYAQHGTAARAASTWSRRICPEKEKNWAFLPANCGHLQCPYRYLTLHCGRVLLLVLPLLPSTFTAARCKKFLEEYQPSEGEAYTAQMVRSTSTYIFLSLHHMHPLAQIISRFSKLSLRRTCLAYGVTATFLPRATNAANSVQLQA